MITGGLKLHSLTKNSNKLVAAALAAGFIATSGVTVAVAQTDSRTTTVTERPRPELDALGVRQGSFIVFPSLEVGETYNDNIFATQNNENDDFITTVTPAIRARSDWNQHLLQLDGKVDVVRYASSSQEDHEEWQIGANGRLDIRRDTNATAAVKYEVGSEERGSVDDANGVEPTEFDVTSLDAGFEHSWNRVSADVNGSFRQRDFDDVRTTTGTTNNDDRDRDEYKLDVRGGYEIQPEYEAFLRLILTSINYNDAVDDAGVNRDNDGYEIRAGARIDLTGLLFGDVFAGYIRRDYDDPSLSNVDDFTAGVDLTWNVTPLTTIKGGVRRLISETTLASASGNLSTEAKASVDHELLRNLILSGRIGFKRDEFEGTNREDEYSGAGVGAKYLLNRYLTFTLDYEYTNRDSNAANSDYDRNKFLLKVRAQL